MKLLPFQKNIEDAFVPKDQTKTIKKEVKKK